MTTRLKVDFGKNFGQVANDADPDQVDEKIDSLA
jgi:hypothetical protein